MKTCDNRQLTGGHTTHRDGSLTPRLVFGVAAVALDRQRRATPSSLVDEYRERVAARQRDYLHSLRTERGERARVHVSPRRVPPLAAIATDSVGDGASFPSGEHRDASGPLVPSLMPGRAAAAREAHNLQVAGSSPAPANRGATVSAAPAMSLGVNARGRSHVPASAPGGVSEGDNVRNVRNLRWTTEHDGSRPAVSVERSCAAFVSTDPSARPSPFSA